MGRKRKAETDSSNTNLSDNDDFAETVADDGGPPDDGVAPDVSEVHPDRVQQLVANNKTTKGSVVYWMWRDARVDDNWALLYAQQRALTDKKPLVVAYVHSTPTVTTPLRRMKFILQGLNGVKRELAAKKIDFKLLAGKDRMGLIKNLLTKLPASLLVCDFSPLRGAREAVESAKAFCEKAGIEMVQVDAHNIVPVWIASNKQEVGARTIRSKIHKQIPTFLTEFPKVQTHPESKSVQLEQEYSPDDPQLPIMFPEIITDNDVADLPKWCVPGKEAAMNQIKAFCKERLTAFEGKRNDPNEEVQSYLSVYFNTGQLSTQRAILDVLNYAKKNRSAQIAASKDSFFEEAVIRRELSDNFCYYNPNYDTIEGAPNWAQQSLRSHKKDKRAHIYSEEELRDGKTYDDLWNAAQRQLVKEGKMHGFMRMYWAKKILEWTPSAEEALRIGLFLNDKYHMDGSDPNGIVGVMWSTCGVHDQGWTERDVFGKVRYMNFNGCQRKFNVNAYIKKWLGKDSSNNKNNKNSAAKVKRPKIKKE